MDSSRCASSASRPAAVSSSGEVVAGRHRIAFGLTDFGRQPATAGPRRPVAPAKAVVPGRRRCRRAARRRPRCLRAGCSGRCSTGRPAARHRSIAAARRRASTAQSASAATVRRDTTCPGRAGSAPAGPTAALSRAASSEARWRLCGPSAAVVHSSSTWLSTDTKVGSPPMVSRTSPAASRSSTCAADVADRLPGLVGVGQRDAWVFVDAGDGVGEFQHRFAGFGAAADGGCARRVRRGGQRDVALAGEQPRRRVQPDPARTGDVHLGPARAGR